MIETFKEIQKQEKNENTALIIMLGILSEKLTDITDLLSMTYNFLKGNKPSASKIEKNEPKEVVIIQPISKIDYID